MHPVQGKVRVLNPVGARVWELADGQRTLGDIVEAIATEFQVDVARVETDIPVFCEDLAQRGVLSFDLLTADRLDSMGFVRAVGGRCDCCVVSAHIVLGI